MMTLLERLRHVQHFGRYGLGMSGLVGEAADEIKHLTAELAATKEESAETCRKLLDDNHRLEVQLAEARKHERQTHETLGAILGDDDALHVVVQRVVDQNAALREYVEIITDGGTDYPESWDDLQRLGLIVEVKPTQEYEDEWGDGVEMWVLAWKAGEFKAIDAEKDQDNG